MSRSPTFSVVIPSYNYAHFLVNALESVLAQKRSDIQVLLIDDASVDETPQIAAKYRDHIQYVRNSKNLGAGGAWQVGLELAEGKYLLKLDADDELLPGHLNAMERAFESDDKIGIVLASVITKYELTGVLEPEYITHIDQKISASSFRKKLLESFDFRMPGCALRREIILGKESPDHELFQIHDWEYFLRVTNGYKAMLLREPLAIYRVHESSITAVAKSDDRLFNDIKRWLAIAEVPGERFLNENERRILKGSCASLLLSGFGSKLNPKSYVLFVLKYLRALSMAYSGGMAQVGRMHHVFLKRVLIKFGLRR